MAVGDSVPLTECPTDLLTVGDPITARASVSAEAVAEAVVREGVLARVWAEAEAGDGIIAVSTLP